jgi:hypothetical protein
MLTPLPLIKEIRVGRINCIFVSRIQFAIRLATSKIIRQSQGWLSDEMVFGLRNICKHGPTYTTFSHIGTTK